jgi:hypothetical protein
MPITGHPTAPGFEFACAAPLRRLTCGQGRPRDVPRSHCRTGNLPPAPSDICGAPMIEADKFNRVAAPEPSI